MTSSELTANQSLQPMLVPRTAELFVLGGCAAENRGADFVSTAIMCNKNKRQISNGNK